MTTGRGGGPSQATQPPRKACYCRSTYPTGLPGAKLIQYVLINCGNYELSDSPNRSSGRNELTITCTPVRLHAVDCAYVFLLQKLRFV